MQAKKCEHHYPVYDYECSCAKCGKSLGLILTEENKYLRDVNKENEMWRVLAIQIEKDYEFKNKCLEQQLQEAQEENKRLESRSEIMQKEHSRVYKKMCVYGQLADELEIKITQSQDRERVLREALEKVNNLAWDVLSTLENERGVVEGQLEYDYLKDIEVVIDKALGMEGQ